MQAQEPPKLIQDERFKSVDSERFKKKKKTEPKEETKNSKTKKSVDKRFKTALPNKKSKQLLIGQKGKKKT